MRIRNLMAAEPIFVRPGATIPEAIELMKKSSIRHLPVVDGDGILTGFVTLSDLKQALVPSMLGELDLADITIRNPVVVHPDDDVELAARLIHEKKIGGMPVVDDNRRLLGVLTVTDILKAFIEMMGLLTASVRLDVDAGGDPEAFTRITGIIGENGGTVLSAGIAAHRTDRRIYYIRLAAGDVERIEKALTGAGYPILKIWA